MKFPNNIWSLTGARLARLLLAGTATLAFTVSAGAVIEPGGGAFGPLPEATWSGSGIQNSEVVITTIEDGANTITLGLMAHARFEGSLNNDGVGTFFSGPSLSEQGDPGGAKWNFNLYVDIAGGATFADYKFELLYDFDPAEGTAKSDHGVWDINAGLPFFPPLESQPGEVTRFETSQNSNFGFLSNDDGVVITPPPGAFDSSALGEYSFGLVAYTNEGIELGSAGMHVLVNVECPSEGLAVFNVSQGGPSHASIQAAVDAASAGDVLKVCPGTYAEASSHSHIALHVDVPDLTITSVGGAGETFIDAGGRTNAVILGGTANNNKSDAGGITIEGFTVQNFTDRGIAQRWGAGDGITIRDNVVLAGEELRIGILVWTGSGAQVTGNVVEAAPFFDPPGNHSSAAISAFGSSNAVISGNTVTEGDVGINISGNWPVIQVGQAQNNKILNNTLASDSWQGVTSPTTGIRLDGDVAGTEIKGNTVAGYGAGIGFQVLGQGPAPDYPAGTEILENAIQDAEVAVIFRTLGTAMDGIVDPILVKTFRDNRFLEGVITGVSSLEPEIDARHNFWGAASGPLDQKTLAGAGERAINNVSASGAAVAGPVRYWPWLVQDGDDLDVTSLVPVTPRKLSGDASIIGNPDGNTVYAERYGAPIVIEYSRTPASVVQREYPPEPGNGSVIDTPLAANRIVNDVDVSDFLKTAVLAEFSQQEVDVDFTVTKSGSATSHVDVTPTSGTISAGTSQEFTFAVGNRRFAGRLRINGVLRNGNPVSDPGTGCIGELARDAECTVTINQQDTVVTFVIGT